jgi:hypothetical protein
LLLAAACPEASWEELAKLPLGLRDRKLVELRAACFGERMPLSARCPACDGAVEFGVTAAEIGWDDSAAADSLRLAREFRTSAGSVRYRLPDSLDLASIAELGSEQAERRLVERCVLDASLGGKRLLPAELPGEVLEAVAGALADADPQAEVTFDLGCPDCGHRWPTLFDIVTVVWLEVSTRAQRLLQEVDALARIYGWREADVLGLSAQRRSLYVQMALS